jgi:hypothetical protein
MQLVDPPKEKNLAMHLHWHLFVNGTRAQGERKHWDKAEFVRALITARNEDEISSARGRRRSDHVEIGEIETLRSLNGWLRGDHLCAERPWGVLIDRVIFGRILGQNSTLDQWRLEFQEARKPPQERHRSELYTSAATPEKVRTPTMERITAALEKNGWRVETFERGQGCTNLEFNRSLVVRPPIIRLNCLNDPWNALDRFDEDLLTFALAQKSGDANRDKKIRVASDFVGSDSVDVQETDYFSSLMTDQLAWTFVHSKALQKDGMTPQKILWDGTSAFIDITNGRLKSLGEATISNQLGASTLAFSTDGYLMIVHQNARNQQSANTLAPSGSGSLDWSDILKSNAHDLLTLVRYGAERELREECALDDDDSHPGHISSEIKITGFVRMLHRAGKPEFFGLGLLGATADKIRKRTPERYVEEVIKAELPRANWDTAQPTKEIARVCQAYREKAMQHESARISLSYPLEHALKLTIDLCQDSQAGPVLNQFVQQALPKLTAPTSLANFV